MDSFFRKDRVSAKLGQLHIEAEATPRRARGVARKATTQQMHHLAKTPKCSTVIRAKLEEATREVDGQRPPVARPWERAIEVRQQRVRNAYSRVEQELRDVRDEVSRKAADQLADLLKTLPQIETERASTKRQLVAIVESG